MTRTTVAESPYNTTVVDAANAVQDDIRRELLDLVGTEAAVVAAAPAGAGKSHFVVDTIGRLRGEGLRVAVVAPTNEQVHSLVDRITVLHPGLPVACVHAKGRDLVASHRRPAWREPTQRARGQRPRRSARRRNGRQAGGRLPARWARRLRRPRHRRGVPGGRGAATTQQPLSPLPTCSSATRVSSIPSPRSTTPTFWRGGAEDPLQTAVGVLLRNHTATPSTKLPISRRLDPRAVPWPGPSTPAIPSTRLCCPESGRCDSIGPAPGTKSLCHRRSSAGRSGRTRLGSRDTPGCASPRSRPRPQSGSSS